MENNIDYKNLYEGMQIEKINYEKKVKKLEEELEKYIKYFNEHSNYEELMSMIFKRVGINKKNEKESRKWELIEKQLKELKRIKEINELKSI